MHSILGRILKWRSAYFKSLAPLLNLQLCAIETPDLELLLKGVERLVEKSD
jgi:hypothetical protein